MATKNTIEKVKKKSMKNVDASIERKLKGSVLPLPVTLKMGTKVTLPVQLKSKAAEIVTEGKTVVFYPLVPPVGKYTHVIKSSVPLTEASVPVFDFNSAVGPIRMNVTRLQPSSPVVLPSRPVNDEIKLQPQSVAAESSSKLLSSMLRSEESSMYPSRNTISPPLSPPLFELPSSILSNSFTNETDLNNFEGPVLLDVIELKPPNPEAGSSSQPVTLTEGIQSTSLHNSVQSLPSLSIPFPPLHVQTDSNQNITAFDQMLIIKNQNTIISKLDTIISEQRILRQVFEHALQSNMIGSNDHCKMTCFKLSPINDAKELKSFDEQLGTDREFRQKLIQYIRYKTNDTRTEHLLHCAIDICFSKKKFS
ncbi:uncharacterized protein LOC121600937 [Anopheles merus]|uniref:uncharacterized protein LOC121600937 n=1 Tax=Anopheles merus TaxID=30066 RepID=UPI001BE3DFF2|nr:uncharacterized protein LOC121600937 [Anopheles merus]